MSRLPDIFARSFADAQREIDRLGESSAVVSIGSPETRTPDGFDADDPSHLRLQFDDVTSEAPSLRTDEVHPPRREHIEKLLDWWNSLHDVDSVYCHCAAGISRSTAAAFILRCHAEPPGNEQRAMKAVLKDNPFASPNRLMVERADELLDRNGQMIEAVHTVCRQLDNHSS